MSEYSTPISGLNDVIDPLRHQVETLERTVARNSQSPWRAAALINSFTEYGDVNYPWSAPAYYKDSAGRVYFRGGLQCPGGARPITMFTLPEGFRPKFAHTFALASKFSTAVQHFGVTVMPSGVVKLDYGDTSANVSLDLVQFRTI